MVNGGKAFERIALGQMNSGCLLVRIAIVVFYDRNFTVDLLYKGDFLVEFRSP